MREYVGLLPDCGVHQREDENAGEQLNRLNRLREKWDEPCVIVKKNILETERRDRMKTERYISAFVIRKSLISTVLWVTSCASH